METLLITYDLHRLGQRYNDLRSLIRRTFPGAWEHLQSVFIVKTTMTPVQVRDLLAQSLDNNDELLVVALARHGWATWGVPQSAANWLHANA